MAETSLADGIGFSGTFFLYAAIGVLAFAFVYCEWGSVPAACRLPSCVFSPAVCVPETKGKSLEEIQEVMESSTLQADVPCLRSRRGYRIE
jgi:hypothetical protein